MQRLIAMIVLAAAALWLGGCASPGGPTEVQVPAGSYSTTFDAARHVLRDSWFDLERVDASAGVITTRPKHSAGLLTPWEGVESSAAQEVDDVMQNQRRVVRVTFERPGGVAGTPAAEGAEGATGGAKGEAKGEASEDDAGPMDLRAVDEPLVMRVRVVVLRDYKPGWQLQTGSVRLSTHMSDPALSRRGMEPDFETAADEDPLLAGRLAREINERAAKGAAARGGE